MQQLTDTSGASGHQKLRVCDVCGAYLSVLDSDRRLADHFGGKVRFRSLQDWLLRSDLPNRCIWDITSFGICFPNSKRNEKRERWHLLAPRRQEVDLLRQVRDLEETIGHSVEERTTVTVTVIAGMTASLRDMS